MGLHDAVDFTFPANTILGAGERIILVGFQSNDAVRSSSFGIAMARVSIGLPSFRFPDIRAAIQGMVSIRSRWS
jgi:hypothetical protein